MKRVATLFFIIFFSSFAVPAIAADDYICPMHPQIHGKKEDTCSICHMPLELAGAKHTHVETPSSPPKESRTPAKPEIKADGAVQK